MHAVWVEPLFPVLNYIYKRNYEHLYKMHFRLDSKICLQATIFHFGYHSMLNSSGVWNDPEHLLTPNATAPARLPWQIRHEI